MAEVAGSRVLILGLTPTMNEAVVRPLFKKFGKITSVVFQNDGSAVVGFAKTTSSAMAISSMNNAVLGGQRIGVKEIKTQKVQAETAVGANNDKAATTRKWTTVCKKYLAGTCKLGDQCKYLHDIKQKDTAEVKISTSKLRKSRICTNFVQGNCTRGDECAFLHSTIPPPKTIVCKNFKTGTCSYGEFCNFLHADKSPIICKNFTQGNCELGDECTFTHAARNMSVKRKAEALDNPAVPKPSAKKSTKVVATVDDSVANCETKEVTPSKCAECLSSTSEVKCENCECSFCKKCDGQVHTSRIMSTHKRNAIVIDTAIKCAECKPLNNATVFCTGCQLHFCSKCSWNIHEFRVFRSHRREGLSASNTTSATSNTPVSKSVVSENTLLKKSLPESASISSSKPVLASKPVIVKPTSDPLSNLIPYQALPKMVASSSESESENEDEDMQISLNVPSTVGKMQALPAISVEDASESDSDDESSNNNFKSQSAAATKSAPVTSNTIATSSESESDFDDKMVATSVAPVKPTTPATLVESSSESSSESDSDSDSADKKASTPAAPVKRMPATTVEISESSSDSSSDSEDESPVLSKMHADVSKKPHSTGVSATNSKHSVVLKIENYHQGDETETLHLSSNLNSFERLLAHDVAEKLGLLHESVGTGIDRHITISKNTENAAKKSKSWSKSKNA